MIEITEICSVEKEDERRTPARLSRQMLQLGSPSGPILGERERQLLIPNGLARRYESAFIPPLRRTVHAALLDKRAMRTVPNYAFWYFVRDVRTLRRGMPMASQ